LNMQWLTNAITKKTTRAVYMINSKTDLGDDNVKIGNTEN